MLRLNQLFLFVCLFSAVVVFAQEDGKGSLIQNVLNSAINLFSGRGSTKDLEQFKDLVQTKETAEISGMIEDNGFKSIQVKSSFNNAAGIPKPLAVNILNHGIPALFPKIVNLVDDKTEAIIKSAIEMCKLFVEFDGSEHEFMDFGLQFKNKEGRVNLIKLHIQQNNGDWDFFSGYLDGTFVKAPSFLIVQKAKGNFFSSKSWVELVPIQRGVTEHDIARFFAFVAPAMGAYRPPGMPSYQPNAMVADYPEFDGVDDFDEMEYGADFDDVDFDDVDFDDVDFDDVDFEDFDDVEEEQIVYEDLAEGEEDDVADVEEGEFWEPSIPMDFPKPQMPFPTFPVPGFPAPGQPDPVDGEEPEDPGVIQYPGGLPGLEGDEAEDSFGFWGEMPSFDDWTPVDQEIEEEDEAEEFDFGEDIFGSITSCIQACKQAAEGSGILNCNSEAKNCENQCNGRKFCKLQCKVELATCVAGIAGVIDECTAACN